MASAEPSIVSVARAGESWRAWRCGARRDTVVWQRGSIRHWRIGILTGSAGAGRVGRLKVLLTCDDVGFSRHPVSLNGVLYVE